MTRRTLLLREPLRRRPFGERPVSQAHIQRRDRVPVAAPHYAPVVARRGPQHGGR